MRAANQETNDTQARLSVERHYATWSLEDQKVWDRLYPRHRAKSPAYDPSRPPNWVRRRNIAAVLSRYAKFLEAECPDVLALPFAKRVTPDLMATFMDELEETCTKQSVRDYVLDICRYAQACDPDVSLRSIREVAQRQAQSQSTRRTGHELCAHDLRRRAECRLDQIGQVLIDRIHEGLSTRREAVMFRSVLQILVLLSLPLRLKNLRSLDFRHFPGCDLAAKANRDRVGQDGLLFVAFEAAEMKNRHAYRSKLPAALSRQLRFYVTHVRPNLACDVASTTTSLWIAPSGFGQSAIGIHQCLTRTTEREFKVRLTAHDFRHIVASTAAKDGHPRSFIATLLQQEPNSRTVERYIATRSDAPLLRQRALLETALSGEQLGIALARAAVGRGAGPWR